MSQPLSPRSPASLNRASTPLSTLFKKSSGSLHGDPHRRANEAESVVDLGPPSSPFQTEVEVNLTEAPASPSLARSHRKERPSPNKTFEIHEDSGRDTDRTQTTAQTSSDRTAVEFCSREYRHDRPHLAMGDLTLSNLREKIYFEHAASGQQDPMRDATLNVQDDFDEHDAPSTVSDDTCFSAFSAVPNADMTMFARLGDRSPIRQTPTTRGFQTPNTSRRDIRNHSRSPSPTPKGRQSVRRDNDTTNLLLDFTGTFDPTRSARPSPSRRGTGSPTKSSTEPNLLSHLRNQRMPSPSKNAATPSNRKTLMNLLDFDLPPQPTPRSIPSITIRELESLKSQYLSEISSLKASLSGREAEVDSLKKAVNDAERRVGEAQESFRDERNAREHAEREKDAWEKKGHEVEAVLKSVREEFESSDKEKEELLQKLEESHRSREDAEVKLAEALSRPSIASGESSASSGSTGEGNQPSEAVITQRVNEQLDEKMENLARELHAVYKKKHEGKVQTLKKTYEARAEKRCHELQQRIDDMAKQIEDLHASKDTTFSAELPSSMRSSDQSEQRQRIESQSAELEEHKARLAGLTEEMRSMRQSQAQLLQDLERERVEKGELVAAVDEMLVLQSEVGAPSALEDFRKSISRPPPAVRSSGIAAPKGSSIPGKSRMMSNIERMGSARANGGH